MNIDEKAEMLSDLIDNNQQKLQNAYWRYSMIGYLNVSEENGLHPLTKVRGIRPDEFIKTALRFFHTHLHNDESFLTQVGTEANKMW